MSDIAAKNDIEVELAKRRSEGLNKLKKSIIQGCR